jgi:hypothetical protein
MACHTEDDVDCIAFGACELVSFQQAVILHVANDWLYAVSLPHFSADGG